MMQKTTVEIVLTTEEADRWQRTIQRAICLLNELAPSLAVPLRGDPFTVSQVRAELLKLEARLGDLPVVGLPQLEPIADPFTAEGDGSARDVLLGRLVENQRQVLSYLAHCARARPPDQRQWKAALFSLVAAWNECEELSRG